MIGLKLQISGASVQMPCDQYVRLIDVLKDGQLLEVLMLGTKEIKTILPTAIRKIFLTDEVYLNVMTKNAGRG